MADRNVQASYDRETSPASRSSSQPPDYVSRITDTDDDDDDGVSYGARHGASPSRKKGGYDSRIEQILYENPDLPILITDAGKNHEGGGGYIVYTIRTGVSLIRFLLGLSGFLIVYRISRSVGVIRSLHLYDRPWSVCTQPSSFRQYQRNIPWPIMLRNRPRRRRTRQSLSCESEC